MDEAYCLSEWMRQHGYSLTEVAEHIDFSPEALSKARDANGMSHRLAHALYEHFGIRVIADGAQVVPGDLKDGPTEYTVYLYR